jgi:2-iminobutanoate/2-iminopropanoate deaminase
MRTKGMFLGVFLLLLALCTSVLSGSHVSQSDKRTVSAPDFPKPIGPYSEAVVAGGFVFVSGQGPFNTKTQKMELGDIKSETRLELTNISTILKASNSSLENVVKVTVFLADLNDFEAMNEVYREFFKENLPARTTVQAVLLTKRKVVFDCIARVNP